ncbi:MAG TPA: hypothetical protein VH186_13945 [Chloroflexia bacterium]|nr:hypothetical protein [Chloroflexia bacterium]
MLLHTQNRKGILSGRIRLDSHLSAARPAFEMVMPPHQPSHPNPQPEPSPMPGPVIIPEPNPNDPFPTSPGTEPGPEPSGPLVPQVP